MYLEIDEGFVGHRKTIRFCGLMQNQEAWSHLVRLWSWACRGAPDGDLSGMDPAEVEIAMGWRTMDGRCYAAAVKAGFIDELADGSKRIHNWEKRTGGAIKRMADEADRKKRWRLHRDNKCGGEGGGSWGAPPCQFCVRADDPPSASRGRLADVSVRVSEASGDADVHVSGRGHPADATTQSRQDQSSQDKASQDQGGDLPRARDPRAPGGVGLREIVETWAKVRHEKLGSLPWQTTYPKPEKGAQMVALFEEHPELAKFIEPTMALVVERSKESQDPRDRESAFGLGVWWSKFVDLCEEVQGLRAPAGKPADCDFHRGGHNEGKAAPKHVFRASCPECRHVSARASPRPASDPTAVGDVMKQATTRR